MQIKNLNGRVLREVSGNSLRGADLSRANLYRANLLGADLSEANLSKAYLCKADLRVADLIAADLTGADLSKADLRGADLSKANLREADLTEANLRGANLSGAVLPLPITPSEGKFTGYKKVRQADDTYVVIKLLILADAQRTSALASRKCRASRVKVVEGQGVSPTHSRRRLIYTPGTTVTADSFNSDRLEECTHGIHFFLTREEAEEYQP